VLSDEIPTFAAHPQDFNLAQHLCADLKSTDDDPNIYTDGAYFYYSIELLTPVTLRLGRPTNETKLQRVWLRSYMVVTGGITEPADMDEVLADGQRGFRMLTDAVIASQLESHASDLLSADNTCYGCYGEKTHDLTQAACKNCHGAGFISYSKPTNK
jgi:hypothetical protein